MCGWLEPIMKTSATRRSAFPRRSKKPPPSAFLIPSGCNGRGRGEVGRPRYTGPLVSPTWKYPLDSTYSGTAVRQGLAARLIHGGVRNACKEPDSFGDAARRDLDASAGLSHADSFALPGRESGGGQGEGQDSDHVDGELHFGYGGRREVVAFGDLGLMLWFSGLGFLISVSCLDFYTSISVGKKQEFNHSGGGVADWTDLTHPWPIYPSLLDTTVTQAHSSP